MKSLDVGFEADKDSEAYEHLRHQFPQDDSKPSYQDLRNSIQAFTSGDTSVDELYESLNKVFFPKLPGYSDEGSWELFRFLLKTIEDPERRANLHLRYLRDRPRIKTLCCNREHCFRCKVKDYHEGKSCSQTMENLDHSVVSCPTCSISLAKGDGCNTVTCVCGKQFSWSAEKENSERCKQFFTMHPEKTSLYCVELLCSSNTDRALLLKAKAWQVRNRFEVDKELRVWFKEMFWPCPSQRCVTLQLDAVAEGIREAAALWRTEHAEEVQKAERQSKIALASIFTTLYPDERDRPAAAHRLANTSRRIPQSGLSDPLLIRSAAIWTETHRQEFLRGMEELEVQSARQFLYLYGGCRLSEVKPALVSFPSSFEWDRETSNPDLTFTEQNTSVERVGSVSCYPAAFSPLLAERAMFRVVVETAPESSNWLTFGLAKKGMPNSNSDGVGRSNDSWGISDDRSSTSKTVVGSCGATMGHFRKFRVGDVLTCMVDTAAGWCEVSINSGEHQHRFDIPVGTLEDYTFAMTFANDHRVSIVTEEESSVDRKAPSAGELNASHSQMFNNFKKHLRLIMAGEEEGAAGSKPWNTADCFGDCQAPTPLMTMGTEWVELCGDMQSAEKLFDMLRPDVDALISHRRQGLFGEDSAVPWMTFDKLLHAASWHRVNRAIVQESRDAELAFAFFLQHQDDAPFIAAVNLGEYHAHKVEPADAQASLAFMRFYTEEMQAWYDYDAQSREPVIENVALGCRCLPRHVKACPHCH